MLSNVTKVLTNAFGGPAQARAAHRQALRMGPTISLGVDQLKILCQTDGIEDDAAPIFLLSAGWRSGSTLLQRLIMSDKSVLIWGEPYDECGLIQNMASSMRAFRTNWPPNEYYYDGTPSEKLTGAWIANLFPSIDDWRKAQRALFDTLFYFPAKKAGAVRWGIKEVRLTADHCTYLRWLYPNAKFLFLYRNPLDAYRSYCRYGRNWYDTFPDKPMLTPTAFGRHWRVLMEGFLKNANYLDALLVKYEDLKTNDNVLKEVENYLGVIINRSVISNKVGSSESRDADFEVNSLERWLLKRSVMPVAGLLGYYKLFNKERRMFK